MVKNSAYVYLALLRFVFCDAIFVRSNNARYVVSEKVKKIASLLPMTYAVDLMQGAFAGEKLGGYRREFLILGLTTIVFVIGGSVLYKRKDWT